jgi:hypothetical protein
MNEVDVFTLPEDIVQVNIDSDFKPQKISFDELLDKIEKESFKTNNSGLVYTYEDCKQIRQSKCIKILNENKIAIIDHISMECFNEKIRERNKSGLKKGNREVSEKTTKQAVENLFLISDYKMKSKTAKKFGFNYRCVFITLTAKSQGDMKEFQKRMWRSWRMFYESLRKKYKFAYVLTKEKHKSGYVHYHIVADLPYISVEKLNSLWIRCLEKNGLLGGKNALDLKILKEYLEKKNSYRAVIKYICKYISKSFNSDEEIQGMRAVWSKGLSKKIKIERSRENLDCIIDNAKKIIKLQVIDDIVIKSVFIIEIDVKRFFKEEIEKLKNKVYGRKNLEHKI